MAFPFAIMPPGPAIWPSSSFLIQTPAANIGPANLGAIFALCANWRRRFDEPIKLPGGGKLFTLKGAIAWLAKEVPKSEHSMKQVQAAAHCVTDAAENGGPTIFACINDVSAGLWTGTAMSVVAPVGSRFWIVGPKTGAARCDGSRTMFAFGVLWYCTCFSRFSRRFTV